MASRVDKARDRLQAHTEEMDTESVADRYLECCLLADLWREMAVVATERDDHEEAAMLSQEHDRATKSAARWNRLLQTDILRKLEAEVEAQKKATNRMRQLRPTKLAVVGEAE